ncbi:DUF2931 family protein [Pseudomonas sp. ALS1131]|nr:DUF2931 family protein [Pseudomonas sp. ALS1131]
MLKWHWSSFINSNRYEITFLLPKEMQRMMRLMRSGQNLISSK